MAGADARVFREGVWDWAILAMTPPSPPSLNYYIEGVQYGTTGSKTRYQFKYYRQPLDKWGAGGWAVGEVRWGSWGTESDLSPK